MTNPILIAEVLSPSVKRYDRGENPRLFRMVPSLREFLLVERDATEVEHWLESIECELPVAEIYQGADEYVPGPGL